jgi:hypothetical protein
MGFSRSITSRKECDMLTAKEESFGIDRLAVFFKRNEKVFNQINVNKINCNKSVN